MAPLPGSREFLEENAISVLIYISLRERELGLGDRKCKQSYFQFLRPRGHFRVTGFSKVVISNFLNRSFLHDIYNLNRF